ncbi:hypothetical protein [Rhodovulum sulfidophilum]|uniref:hypothetical protein n=1 Tax=Rhodovulum sulfidophilum TaxID=35806 RepID=UPI0015BA8110|nr:hypothetical protein [Rhodovulum sulfidophilum]MBL3554328.1 hypothetical protein [Rhodovulum sulfidophilum]
MVGKTVATLKDQHVLDFELSVFSDVPMACTTEFDRTWQPEAAQGLSAPQRRSL